jgi:hypothetical protein
MVLAAWMAGTSPATMKVPGRPMRWRAETQMIDNFLLKRELSHIIFGYDNLDPGNLRTVSANAS